MLLVMLLYRHNLQLLALIWYTAEGTTYACRTNEIFRFCKGLELSCGENEQVRTVKINTEEFKIL